MQKMTVEEITSVVGGQLLCGDPQTVITNVQYDSREVGEGSLFVPIKGEKVDAHKFIPQCMEKGAATFTEYDAPEGAGKPYIKVGDTRLALQKLAAGYRSEFPALKLAGVTGSVGKTSTKEMIAAALSGGLIVMKTSGNKNSQIGMPMTMFDIAPEHQAAVIETGMSEFGEMDRLCDVSRPNIAVMTNIGNAHIENLKTRENIRSEKLKITKHFDNEGILFLNGDDELLRELYGRQPFRTVSFGIKDNNDYYAKDIDTEGFSTEFTCVSRDGERRFVIPALGVHSVCNALVAIAVARFLGLDDDKIQIGLRTYKNAPMRQQIHSLTCGDMDITLIDDSYNASPEATKVSLDVLKSIGNGKTVAVLADMLELGEQSAKLHYGVGEHLAKIGVDCLIATGELSRNTAKGAQENGCPDVTTADSNEQAFEILEAKLSDACTVLVKGSRGMHTDEICSKLIAQSSSRS